MAEGRLPWKKREAGNNLYRMAPPGLSVYQPRSMRLICCWIFRVLCWTRRDSRSCHFLLKFFCFRIKLMMDEISLLSFHLLLMPLLLKFILSHVCTVFNLFYLIPCHYVAWWAGIKLYELNLFLLSASIWHEHCLILSFDVIDYSFDWFCFTGHAQNKKEIKLQNIEISLDWKISMVMVHS